MEETKSISIVGRRWFQRSYGNTYFSADIYVNGVQAGRIPFSYGYGDQYLYEAIDWLEENGYMPDREHHENGSAEPGWRYFRDDRGIPFEYSVMDVPRKKDL